MICFNCGNDAGEEYQCPYCQAGQLAYRRIVVASNAAYNEGLSCARFRDLSGATEHLKKSLKFDKYNTVARNLLGLVYFEMGWYAYALREWVLSKKLQPEQNPVDAYLAIVQSKSIINRFDQITQKYNQALLYCSQGSYDLARIQLKRIVGSNPNMIAAQQLLALVLIKDGKFEEARKALYAAAKVDCNNPVTVRYLNAVRSEYASTKRKKHVRKRTGTETDFSTSNDANIVPRTGILDIIDRNGNGFINILAGVALGVLVALFLIVPTIRQNENSRASSALVSANKEAVNSANNIASLEKEVESLGKELEKYTGKGDIKTSYEKLMEAEAAMQQDDRETANQAIEVVNRELLDINGKEKYDTVTHELYAINAKESYAAGSAAFKARRYSEAIEELKKVVDFDPEYSDGYALYYLAQSYENSEEMDLAIPYYKQFVELFPGTSRARSAAVKVSEYGGDTEAGETD